MAGRFVNAILCYTNNPATAKAFCCTPPKEGNDLKKISCIRDWNHLELHQGQIIVLLVNGQLRGIINGYFWRKLGSGLFEFAPLINGYTHGAFKHVNSRIPQCQIFSWLSNFD